MILARSFFSKSFQLTLVDRSTLSSAEKLVPKSGKQAESFRNYEASAHQDRVERTYSLMHQNQTVDFVKKKVQRDMGITVFIAPNNLYH